MTRFQRFHPKLTTFNLLTCPQRVHRVCDREFVTMAAPRVVVTLACLALAIVPAWARSARMGKPLVRSEGRGGGMHAWAPPPDGDVGSVKSALQTGLDTIEITTADTSGKM